VTQEGVAKLVRAVREGRRDEARSITQSLLEGGSSAKSVLDRALVPAMDEVGSLFAEGVYFIPEVLLAARAMKDALAVLEPHLKRHAGAGYELVVIGTVKGDLHDIGKNIVGVMLEGAGFRVVDLGVDVSPSRFRDVAVQHGASIVALSALLATTMRSMETTVDLLRRERGVKTLIGGAPVTRDFARLIGADGYAPDAAAAVAEARRLVSTRQGARSLPT
jgi:5-methyltetrahydrofolate--homocysteine methyltransferase